MSSAYNLVFKRGIFNEDCKLWRRKPSAQKSRDNFKTYFITSHQYLQEYQSKAKLLEYQENSDMYTLEGKTQNEHDKLDSISNIASKTTGDRRTIATLTATQATIRKQYINLNRKILGVLKNLVARGVGDKKKTITVGPVE